MRVSAKAMKLMPKVTAGEVVKRKKSGVVSNVSNKAVNNKASSSLAAATTTTASSVPSTAAGLTSVVSASAPATSSAAVVNKRRWGSGGYDTLKDKEKDKDKDSLYKGLGSKTAAFPMHGGRLEAYKGVDTRAGAGAGDETHPLIAATLESPPTSTSSSPEEQSGQMLVPAARQGLVPAEGLGPPRHVISVRAHRVIVCAKETIDGAPHPFDLTPHPTSPQPPTTSTTTHPVDRTATATHYPTSTTTSSTTTNTATTTNTTNNNTNTTTFTNNTTTDNDNDSSDIARVTARWTGSFTDPRFRAPLTEHALTGQVTRARGEEEDTTLTYLTLALLPPFLAFLLTYTLFLSDQSCLD